MSELTHDATSRTLETERGTLHYHEAGDGPPLLLLHGSGPGVSGWANFRGNLPAFTEHFRTLVLDFPGFGKSYSCEGSPLMAAPQAVLDFLDGMALDRSRSSATRWAATSRRRIAALNPTGSAASSRSAEWASASSARSPPEGVKLLVQFVEDPTRERLVAWMESMVYDPVDPHRGVRRVALAGGDRTGCAGGRPSDVQLEGARGDAADGTRRSVIRSDCWRRSRRRR